MLYILLFTSALFANNVLSLYVAPEVEEIVGGVEANIEDYKYQVVVLHSSKVWCGGSILTTRNVLTAGHCVRLAFEPLVIRAGSTYWFEGGSLHNVTLNFTLPATRYNDIALLVVKEPFIFDGTRTPIQLAKPDTVLASGALASVCGWGSNETGKFPDRLWVVEVPLVDKETCSKMYNGTRIGEIVDGEICAGTKSKDSCQGDSGSPLVLNGVQIGVVSMGYGCGLPEYAGIYADVAYYHDRIQSWIASSNSTPPV